MQKMQSILHVARFLVRLPIVTIGFIYKSFVYVGFTVPKLGGKFVFNKVDKSCRSVSKWYYGENIEEDHVSLYDF